LLFLLEQTKKGFAFKHISFNYLLILFLTTSLLLLSSKLVIGFTFIIFLYYVFLGIRKGNAKAIVASSLGALLLITIILSFQNKISSRFKEITSGDLRLLKQKNFDPGTYFNGLQFRVLQVRFVREILDEKDAWLSGVNPNMQELLDQKYIETNMYTGDGVTEDRGYLGLNTHNQFLESLLQSGWPGLIAFVLACLALIRMAFRRKNRELTITIILLLLYCLNESVFETQYGLILYTFLPMFLYYGTARRGQRRRRKKIKPLEIPA
jgi:O-antigen ligase